VRYFPCRFATLAASGTACQWHCRPVALPVSGREVWMKKRMMSFAAAILVIVLAGCASKSLSPYSVAADETAFTVNPENSTVSDGENIYLYEISETSSGYRVKFQYPNGAFYWWEVQGTGLGVGGHDENYDENTFAAGDTLLRVLERELPKRRTSRNISLIVFLLGLGILDTFWPRAVWYLTVRWQCKNGEPSGLALKLIRFSGVAAFIPASNEPSAALARAFGECREGQIPRSLLRGI